MRLLLSSTFSSSTRFLRILSVSSIDHDWGISRALNKVPVYRLREQNVWRLLDKFQLGGKCLIIDQGLHHARKP
jgi:hypothetical protein